VPSFLRPFSSIPKSKLASERRQESKDSDKRLRKNYSKKPIQVCPSPTDRIRQEIQNISTTPIVGMLDIEKESMTENMKSTCSELSSIFKSVIRCRFCTAAGSFKETSVDYNSEDEDATIVASNISCRRRRRQRKRPHENHKSIASGLNTAFSKKLSTTRQKNTIRRNGRRYWKL